MSAQPSVIGLPSSTTTYREISARWPVDEIGPEQVVFLQLPTGHAAVVVIDNIALGPAIGGLRMTPGVDATEVARLARAMTLKNATAALPHGGAKAGIIAEQDLSGPDRERVVRGFARAIAGLTDYVPGPDMGTDETAMAWVHDEIGRAVGLPAVLGGIPLDELGATGFGIAVCASALQDAGVVDLERATVAIQGFGAVGSHAALELRKRGATIVAVSEREGATYNRDGLDVEALVALKAGRGRLRDFAGGRPIPRDNLLGLECDILIPAAQPDVLNSANVGSVQAKLIIQGANIPATSEAETMLHRRGILCIPDIVANAGGVICASVEFHGGSRGQAFTAIEEKLRANTAELIDRLRRGITPRQVAAEMGHARLAAAESYRRRW